MTATMGRQVGFLYRGWAVRNPCYGTGMQYEATNPDHPGIEKRFDRPWQARAWIDRHEAREEALPIERPVGTMDSRMFR